MLKRLEPRFVGAEHADALLGGDHGVLCRRDLRLGDEVARAHVVHVLLGNETRLSLRDIFDAGERQVNDLVGGFRAPDFVFGASHLRIGLFDRRRCARQIVAHLGNLQGGDYLPFLDAVADVHADRFEIAGHLGQDIDFLVRDELRRKRQGRGDIRPARRHHRNRWRRDIAGCGRSPLRIMPRARTEHQQACADYPNTGFHLKVPHRVPEHHAAAQVFVARFAFSISAAVWFSCAWLSSTMLPRPFS